ncbi:alpha/beta fold hydrolase [Salinirubellus salinus]|uniref:Alpha/beta fold hydrolase n=1 Tax=Salinirubellus salinus TaxID=1364945 RepID=A0A9E7UBN6_9EURY|nr:DUF3887 domain-containing protein [Salinirubellus salinus]UWM54919.1 alpha/beta fold hydrolase [Salinirubellus salinus]
MTDESPPDAPRRRAVLATLAGGLGVSLAGCSSGPSSPTPSATPRPTDPSTDSPTDDGTPTGTDVPVERLRTLGASVYHLYAVGAFEDARRYYADRFDADLDTEELRGGWDAWTATAGRFEGVAGTVHRTQEGFDVVKVVGAFQTGLVAIDFVFGGNADVVGLFHSNPNTGEYAPPGYAASEAVVESGVALSEASCGLPAVLTTPSDSGSGTVPGVVLVGDDGPRDRNGAVGPNRPLQDLAWGLADRGVASLRYDSRALSCDSLAPEATTLDALVEDATVAVERLRSLDGVGPVAVLGHGLGGWIAPRVAAAATVDGVAVLAAPGRPLTTTRPEAAQRVAEVDGTVEDTEQRWVDHVTSEADRVGDLAADETALGATGAFWASVADYDPVAETSGLSVPTHLLFGGRDFEVPEADRQRWTEAGAVQVVDAANHLLQTGEGPATPGEYAIPNTVAEAVVTDVAEFVTGL